MPVDKDSKAKVAWFIAHSLECKAGYIYDWLLLGKSMVTPAQIDQMVWAHVRDEMTNLKAILSEIMKEEENANT